ncbi:MAG: hypothetical protein ACLFU8_03165 [Anaerolineales bacterium]
MDLRRGFNAIVATVLDAAGNFTYTPAALVYLMPPRDITLTVEEAEVAVGEAVFWLGDLAPAQPVTVTVETTLLAAAPVTQTVTVYWAGGLQEESNRITINPGEGPNRFIYLPLVLR